MNLQGNGGIGHGMERQDMERVGRKNVKGRSAIIIFQFQKKRT